MPGSPVPSQKLTSEPRETEAQSRDGSNPTPGSRPRVPLNPPPPLKHVFKAPGAAAGSQSAPCLIHPVRAPRVSGGPDQLRAVP